MTAPSRELPTNSSLGAIAAYDKRQPELTFLTVLLIHTHGDDFVVAALGMRVAAAPCIHFFA